MPWNSNFWKHRTSTTYLNFRKDKFIKYLLEDKSFRDLSSKEKIEKYKNNGFTIGANVKIAEGTVLIGNVIEIEDNVTIGKNTYIESSEIQIGKNTTIGNNCEFVGSIIQIGEVLGPEHFCLA